MSKIKFLRIQEKNGTKVNVYGDGDHFYVEENRNKELIRLFNIPRKPACREICVGLTMSFIRFEL